MIDRRPTATAKRKIMVIFKKIKWKNLLSTGNIFTEIPLNTSPNALIVGENGAGKSTILDALCFVLFGKPFRKITKTNIVNTVNQKETVVEIEFSTNNKEYKVIRGIKPNVFEIYCNNHCINQDSSSKDYQDYLEKFILKMNFKSFTQIVILGSASFTPFMQLSSADRRAVIEDLLDIQIFSVMNTIVKQRQQVNKEELEKNRIEIINKNEKKQFIEKTIENLIQNNKSKLKSLADQKTEYETTLNFHNSEALRLTNEYGMTLTKAGKLPKLKDRHNKLISLKSKIETNVDRAKKEIAFFEKNDSCPTCRQSIKEEFKTKQTKEYESKIKEYDEGIEKISDEIGSCISDIDEMNKILSDAEDIRNQITSHKSKSDMISRNIQDTQDEIDRITNSDDLVTSSTDELNEVTSKLAELASYKQQLANDKLMIETAINLLKDGGIKTKIIRQYLPIINKYINKYLLQMGFFVDFNINENFEETIKSRFRDTFNYENFSEGEKMRIDLAILFTWRAIAKMRNSVNTNLLLLDEIFDGSLDSNGTDEFLKIMWSMTKDTNTFVISHKGDQLVDKFSKTYRFEKIKNFSRLMT